MRGFSRLAVGAVGALALNGCGQVGTSEELGVVQQLGLTGGSNGVGGCQAATGGTGGAGETVAVFRDGTAYSGTIDTMLEQSVPNTNKGTETDIVLKGGANKRHGLFRWDLSSLPSNTTIRGGCLQLKVQDPSAQSYQVFEVLRLWTEAQATWNVAYIGSPWNGAGAWGVGDTGSDIVGTIPANATGVVTIPLSTALVQRWVSNPSQNFGVALGNNSSNDGISLASSEAPAADRPGLLIGL